MPTHYPSIQQRQSHAARRNIARLKVASASTPPPRFGALEALAIAGLLVAASTGTHALASSLIHLKRCAATYIAHAQKERQTE